MVKSPTRKFEVDRINHHTTGQTNSTSLVIEDEEGTKRSDIFFNKPDRLTKNYKDEIDELDNYEKLLAKELISTVFVRNFAVCIKWLQSNCCHHIETSRFICITTQLTGFYMIVAMVFNELMIEFKFKAINNNSKILHERKS